MKQTLLLTICLLWGLVVYSQDIIVKRNSEEIKAKILEINLLEIKYRKFESPDGPIYVINKSDVFFIKFQDGTKEIITPFDQPVQASGAPVINGKTVKDGFYLNISAGYPIALGDYGKSLESYSNRSAADFNLQFGARLIKYLGIKVQSGASVQSGILAPSGISIQPSSVNVNRYHSYFLIGPELLLNPSDDVVASLSLGYGASRYYSIVNNNRSPETDGTALGIGAHIRFLLSNRVAFMPSVQFVNHSNVNRDKIGLSPINILNFNVGLAINFGRIK